MARKRSTIWMHFDPLKNDHVQCQQCGKIFLHRSGSSTSNLRKHLSTKHPHLFQVAGSSEEKTLFPGTTKYEPADSIANFSILPCNPSSSGFVKYENMMIEDSTGDCQAPTSSDPTFSPAVKIEEIDIEETMEQPSDIYTSHATSIETELTPMTNRFNDQLLYMIAVDMRPLSLVNEQGFRELITGLNPKYKLPTKSELKKHLLPKKYNQVLKVVKQKLNETEYVCLTTDGWTATLGNRIMSISAHYLTSNWEMKSFLLYTFRFDPVYDDEKLASEEFMKMVKDWKIANKISSIINGSYYNVDFLSAIGWSSLNCFAHMIDSIVDNGLKTIEPLRMKIQNIMSYFRDSCHLREKLKVMQFELPPGEQPLNLRLECKAQWTTTYATYSRMCDLQEQLIAVIDTIDEPISKLTDDEWQALREITKILEPFKQVVNELCGEKYMPISKRILLQNGMKSVIQRKQVKLKNTLSKEFAENIMSSMLEQSSGIEKTFAAKACFLDPRFKSHGFLGYPDQTVANVKESIIEELNQMIRSNNETGRERLNNANSSSLAILDSDSDEDSLLWAEFNSRVKQSTKALISPTASTIELDGFLEEPLLARTECALKWWKEHEVTYPQLSKLAKKYMGIVATSASGSRFYTEKGQNFVYRRNHTKWEVMRQLVFLNANMKECTEE